MIVVEFHIPKSVTIACCIAWSVLASGCGDRTCSSDADCPTEQACVAGGGVFFATAVCVVTSPTSDVAAARDAGFDEMGSGVADMDIVSDVDDGDAHTDADKPTSCDDGVVSGTETDIDCGGECEPCTRGARCAVDDDCSSGLCDEVCVWPKSCAEWLAAGARRGDGAYGIDADGPGPAPAIEVFCDMTSDGGVGYTLFRIDGVDADGATPQDQHRAACAKLGLEVVVPRTRGHASAILDWNDGEPPGLVNVFPRREGVAGLQNWQGICQGEPCRFWVNDINRSHCSATEPSGENSTAHSLYRTEGVTDDCPFGGWSATADGAVASGDSVICSTNDAGPPIYSSCLEILNADSVQNTSFSGISGDYVIERENMPGPFEVACDMVSDGGGYTLMKQQTSTAVSGLEAEMICGEREMHLFIPRTKDHRDAALEIALAPTLGPSGDVDYLSIMGIYADFVGARCDARPFHSGNASCEWSASDDGPFFVTDRNTFEDPNGSTNNTFGHSLFYQWNTTGLQNISDIDAPGFLSPRFICALDDEP